MSEQAFYWWLAINGGSCSMSGIPMPTTLEVVPTPELLIGYKTANEARER